MSLTRSLQTLVLVFGLAAALPPGLAAAAGVQGVVIDPDGRVTPGARILLSGPAATIATTLTDDRGRFQVANLDPGRYELRVALDGFRADVVTLELAADERRDIRIQLRVSAIAESIVVSAAHVDRPLSQVFDSIDVISAADLKSRQVETVSAALQGIPGLTVTSSGGRGGLTSLFPRGGESNFTLMLIDGIRVNAFGGGFDFAHLPVADIERIEVVRGPQSALYGSDAIGAVVHIVTRHGGPARTEGVIEGGGFGTTRLALASSGSTGPWSWGAAVERLDTDGFTGTAPATGEIVTNDDYRRRDLSLSGGWRGERGTHLRGDVRLGSYERGFPGPFGSNPVGNFTGVDRISRGKNDTRLLSLGLVHPWTSRVHLQIQVAHSDLDGTFTSPFGRSDSETRRLSVRAQTDVALRDHLGVSLGLEVQRERASSTFITGATSNTIPVRRRVVGSFGEARIDAADQLFVTAGLRVEQIRRDPLEGDPNGFTPRPTFDAASEVSANPKLSLGYFLQPAAARSRSWTRLRFSAGTGIRPPDAFEIAFTDNPTLKPERSRSVDFGVKQALAGGAVAVEATAFFNRYDDLIVAVGRSLQDASQFRTDNIANSQARGVEIATLVRTAWGLDVRLTYTRLATKILAADRTGDQAPSPFQVGDPLLRRPRHQGSIDVRFTRRDVAAYAHLGARGRTLDVEPSFGAFGGLFPETPGYGVVDVGASVRSVWSDLELFGRVHNLFDQDYEETLGFPALGRSAIVGVRVATRR